MTEALSTSEKYLWQYVQEHSDDIVNISIVELSEKANVSTATIVRTMKKMGYSGYTPFRQEAIRKLTNKKQDLKVLKETNHEIRSAILKNQYEVDNTISNLNIGVMEDAIQKVSQAKHIYIFARGLSKLIGEDILLKFELLGKDAQLHDDPNIIKTLSKQITGIDTVAIFLTLNGNTPELVSAAHSLAENDVTTITFTCNNDGNIIQYSDLIFLGVKSAESYFPKYEVRSRLPLQILTRIFLDAYAIRIQSHHTKKAENHNHSI
ncbi:Phosphosugar-binding transcriptional repressor, RpiR family [Pediococcus damnosus]|uniref:MurR/RpiR family transcriptional regulator n=2 Tax=Pediococcus damnosus TaxID=51663 RepID=UPI00078C12B4|nr:MurR/RpiR family transcriptional regulator [Pediococcus damnosus]AMV65817.1 Phosphosugar-binding transcriptional repressor, RpiR family [Pediococcus damnosus]